MNGEELKQWREQHNVTQQRLADALGVPQSTIGRWETGMTIERPLMLDRALRDFARELESERKPPKKQTGRKKGKASDGNPSV